jgi:hypothetical protein
LSNMPQRGNMVSTQNLTRGYHGSGGPDSLSPRSEQDSPVIQSRWVEGLG